MDIIEAIYGYLWHFLWLSMAFFGIPEQGRKSVDMLVEELNTCRSGQPA